MGSAIKRILCREILDSRGNPTLEADVILNDKSIGRATVPSGASKGIHEAVELRDGGKRYLGKGVRKAIKSVSILEKHIKGLDASRQIEIDNKMIELDGTPNKSRLGANAILAVSLASARASAISRKKPLYAQLGKGRILPIPFCNVINGGVHAGNKLKVQEFMIAPTGFRKFSERIRAASETYHVLKDTIAKKYGKSATNVGDEGGFAPPISTPEDALDLLEEAVSNAGYSGKIKYAIDFAASEFFTKGKYELVKGKKLDAYQLIDEYGGLIKNYPIISIEDPFDQDDFTNWKLFTDSVGKKVQVVGDDLLFTNPARIRQGIAGKWCNALLMKVNQVGTLTEAKEAVRLAVKNKWGVMVSHRSGETEDSFIADLVVALGTGQIKSGAPCRSERLAKYNQLLRIEEHLGNRARY